MNDSPLFLILHKVRGAPAFDIAHQLEIGDEIGWIIPTSGHRAYPLTMWDIDEVGVCEPGHGLCHVLHDDYPGWNALPDHYTTLAAPQAGPIRNILAIVGIKPKPFRLKP